MDDIFYRGDIILIIINISYIAVYLLKAWGLYMISKKLGDSYPWLAWIPVIQIYTIVKTGGKSAWWILWLVICFVLSLLSGFFLILSMFSLNYNGLFLPMLCLLLILIITGLSLYIIILHGISKRTGRGAWTTVGLLFIPFIMFPIVGYKLQSNEIKIKEIKIEEEIV